MEEELLPVNALCIDVAVAQYDVDLLGLLWNKTQDTELKERIEKETAALAVYHGLSANTFPELVTQYNEKVLASVGGTSIEEQLGEFVKRRDVLRILLCLEKGAGPTRGARAAAEANDLQLFTLFLEKGAVLTNEYEICNNAAQAGNLDLLQLAHANGAPVTKWTTMIAAKANHFEVLQWLHAKGTKCNDMVCAYAALNGNFEMLRWARENNLPWSVYTPCSAAAGGHLDLLKWVVAEGCPWNDLTCANAAKTGNLEILRWAVENGCPCTEADYAMLDKPTA